jgi:hypothetical protein
MQILRVLTLVDFIYANFFEVARRVSMLCRVQTHFVLVNASCSHLHSYCATGVSSGLAMSMTLTHVTGEVGSGRCNGVDLLLV